MELQRLSAKLEVIQNSSSSSSSEERGTDDNGVGKDDGEGSGAITKENAPSPSWLHDFLPVPPRMSSLEGVLKQGAKPRPNTDRLLISNLDQEIRELKRQQISMMQLQDSMNANIADIQTAVKSMHLILCYRTDKEEKAQLIESNNSRDPPPPPTMLMKTAHEVSAQERRPFNIAA
jgi:hypothetical protein